MFHKRRRQAVSVRERERGQRSAGVHYCTVCWEGMLKCKLGINAMLPHSHTQCQEENVLPTSLLLYISME